MSSSEDWDDFGAKPKAVKNATVSKIAKAPPKAKPRTTGATKKKPALGESNSFLDAEEDIAPAANSRKASSTDVETKTVEEIYQKKTQLEHILIRPDTYIGSVESQTVPMWVFEDDKMVWRNVTFVPGLYKIFDEIIVNAADNKVRDLSMDVIKVNIDKENNMISVYNNGRGIPIEMHSKEQVYVPELIFGHLLTSSNYDDNQKKITGGRNGYGAKLCNIFSTEFIVETADSVTGRKFTQIFSENMSKKGVPKTTSNPRGENYTKITFKPDLAKFGMSTIDNDFEALVKKRVYDLAGCIRGVKVFLNDARLKVKDFKEYAELYVNSATPAGAVGKPTIIYERPNERWEVAFTISDGQFQQVSFVNSICTMKGGTHVNHVADQLVASLIEAVKKKDKKGVPLKPFQAKNHLWLFVNCYIENPAFDSQTKENMTLRQSSFGSKCNISEDFMKKVLKSGVVDNILSFARFKQDQLLKKTDGVKKTRITGMAKLDDANNAGTRNAHKCTLILTEGDSAKSLAVSGLSVVGRDNFGVFPLRGKLLNVREASHSQITQNTEINAIKQILGLQHGKVYTSTDSLRYGHLMIMTDQDHDGSHIKGLIINLLDHFWPSLLKVPGFLLEFITPIVKVTKGSGSQKREQSFFTIPEYEEWKRAHDDGKGWTIKYYKGLGTSTTEDAKKYFSAMNRHLKPFSAAQDGERELIDMAFSKKKADDRKEWLRQFQPGTYMDHSQNRIAISDFINKELILFSMADNARSIPSAVDGLKPGQRKILFSCFKRNLKQEIKVAQLAGYVSEHSAYHHGEQSLCSTIVGMAQNFVGSNNMQLLEPRGQFGTRLQGGKDAASPRYIFTTLSPLARALYHPADDALLAYQNEDGQSIEPEWYLPILPVLLINGGEGIGTGWSSSIPNYNPRDVVENIFRIMDGDDLVPMHPWYRGYKGTIELVGKDKYRVTGVIKKIDETTVEITELPIRTWTQNYKEDLESWLTGTEKQAAWIKDYKEYHTDSSVHFIVTLTEEQMALAEKEGLEKRFKLVSSISTSNLVCFDQEGRIRKYESVEDIFTEFCDLRRKYYQKRKEYLLNQLNSDLTKLDNKVRFVTEIIQGELVVQNKKRDALLQELRHRKYVPIHNKKEKPDVDEEAEDEEESTKESKGHGYDYLLSMPIWNLTMEKVQQLMKQRDQKAEEVVILTGQSINQLWRTDLDAFLAQWDHFERMMEENDSQKPANGTTALGAAKTAPKKNGVSAIAKTKQAAKKVIDEKLDKKAFDVSDDEDDDDDFTPKEKVSQHRATSAKPRTGDGSAKRLTKNTKEEQKVEDVMDVEIKAEPSARKTVATPSVEELAETMSNISITKRPEAGKKRILGGKRAAAPGQARTTTKKATAMSEQLEPAKVGGLIGMESPVEDVVPVKTRQTAKAKMPAKSRAPKATKVPAVVVDESEDDVDDEMDINVLATSAKSSKSTSPATTAEKKIAPSKTKIARNKKAIVDSDSDDVEHVPAVMKKPVSAARATKKKPVVDSDEDDEIVAIPVVATGGRGRSTRGKQPIKYFDPGSEEDQKEEENENESESDFNDDDDY
ncbi:DNA topoisomerase 2 [Spizellomyces punctatus DAOM BR117]|uniref:DNA topoisomerase 2 n=1 Tax=Spizellomyces punctatus (strain DAOM BR117) TaxID=645134 RepID=A0A0L0HS74_SPIPD|nr:DNA topoisomerase 2 [Spizellomyces punctatus DAOM BR117]KND03704.1 hypothetical protein SPPG_01169 [Spizellomyces punctatus DAOM BR117]|eukprot:XP_016611743.1 hypothetical protein SPPG_01169 [Spizellomyces punctatus DAOM BR117]